MAKSRRFKGAPIITVRNVLGLVFIIFGIIGGIMFHYGKLSTKYRKAWGSVLKEPIKEVEKETLEGNTMSNKIGNRLEDMLKDGQWIYRGEF